MVNDDNYGGASASIVDERDRPGESMLIFDLP